MKHYLFKSQSTIFFFVLLFAMTIHLKTQKTKCSLLSMIEICFYEKGDLYVKRVAMKQMKKNKAVGKDEIVFEMIEALGKFGLEKITDIVNYVYESENIPDEMIESIFIALPKKPGTIDC